MNAWDHLPNAALINQVLDDLRANPEVFAAAWSAACVEANDPTWYAACVEARSAVRSAARVAAWDAIGATLVTDAAAAVAAARDPTRVAAWDAAWDAITALVAWDHSARYWGMSYEELRVWAVLSEDPAAVLLVPYVLVREKFGIDTAVS